MIRVLASVAVLSGGLILVDTPDPVRPDPDSPRPIAAVDSVFIEDLTWMEVRDAMRAGKKTVLIATGGVEQNGPYLVTGKHNVVLRGMTESIARRMGNALVAPIIAFVPEGDIAPPSLHMHYPGTISLTEDTYRALLLDVCRSFQTHGFDHIVLIGDSGGNQDGMKFVVDKLNDTDSKSTFHYIPEYYDYGGVLKFLEDNGIKQEPEGLHDDFAITAIMMAVDPKSVRAEQRIRADRFRINGVNLAPAKKTIEWGKKLINFRTDVTVSAIKKSIHTSSR